MPLARIAELDQRMETAARARPVESADTRRFGHRERGVAFEGAQHFEAPRERKHEIGVCRLARTHRDRPFSKNRLLLLLSAYRTYRGIDDQDTDISGDRTSDGWERRV